ncbi:DUF6167 family protein [Streptomyces profundus]|uniref:DUF6167 family protein n=1 Tax=Streptomyces profundus TaxID=2867410 RepID=UPI001D16EE78|nr:DUF6167 family protein [Streptomyces sp. MA3_2.13]UED83032.1 DUF6167 family protein [Streptomyces sp. MA3_2.13]
MMRRVFWFTTGAAAGVWATTRVQRKLRQLTPESLAARAADRAVATGHRLRGFALDVRDGMAERETELNDALGLTAEPPDRALPPAPRRAPLDAAPHLTGPTRPFRPTGNEDL